MERTNQSLNMKRVLHSLVLLEMQGVGVFYHGGHGSEPVEKKTKGNASSICAAMRPL